MLGSTVTSGRARSRTSSRLTTRKLRSAGTMRVPGALRQIYRFGAEQQEPSVRQQTKPVETIAKFVALLVVPQSLTQNRLDCLSSGDTS